MSRPPKPSPLRRACLAALAAPALLMPQAATAADPPVIIGKSDWLFVRYEMPLQELAGDASASIALIDKFSKLLARNQVALAVVVVPSKIETYPEYLPDSVKASPYMAGFNATVQNALRTRGVQTIDLKPAFQASPLRQGPNPLFLRLDTHWSPTGALLAAQTVRTGIDASPVLKKAWEDSAAEKFDLAWNNAKEKETDKRDLVKLHGPGLPDYPPEDVLRFKVTRANAPAGSLLGATYGGDIALVGSSFSADVTGFAAALRYTLQRNLLNATIPADMGPWMMMQSYLSDDAYQTQKPKLVIWEIPERAVSWRPSYAFREARYVLDDKVWLLQAAALAQTSCDAAPINPQLEPTGLMAPSRPRENAATTEADFIEISFDKPMDQTSYFVARVTSNGSRQVTLEATGPAGAARKFSIEVPGDGNAHALKTPLSLDGKAYNRLKIYPGNTTGFGLADVDLCRYPDDLLK